LRLFLNLMLLGTLIAPTHGEDRHDWQSLARLHSGDRVRVVLKAGPVDGEFLNWTAEGLTVGTATARREDVLKVERYRHGGSRVKHAAIGALIGFAGGFATGAAAGSDCPSGLGPCFSRKSVGVLAASAGAVIGGVVGACLPTHGKELIYSAR
jgi:hypothetical protein